MEKIHSNRDDRAKWLGLDMILYLEHPRLAGPRYFPDEALPHKTRI